jgi:SAM-dependent methyltransferase
VPRVDYDLIARLYDEPIRDHPVDPRLLSFLEQRPDLSADRVRILDIGCGTGKQLTADRAQFPSGLLVGVDRFRGMLRIARRRGPSVGWVHGDGGRLPLRSESFDYVTNQFSYHHIADRESFIREVHRVLRPGGRFVLTNIDPWSMPGWAIYRFFPEARDQDLLDCIPADSLADLMRAAGFEDMQVERRHWHQAEDLVSALAYASDRYRTSQLMVISDAAYQAGLNRLRRACATAADDEASVDSEICLVTICADKAAPA